MYIILVYDISDKKVQKMTKLCRRYLNRIQNSVFVGELTQLQIRELQNKIKKIMDLEKDNVIFFILRNEKWIKKEMFGKEINNLSIII